MRIFRLLILIQFVNFLLCPMTIQGCRLPVGKAFLGSVQGVQYHEVLLNKTYGGTERDFGYAIIESSTGALTIVGTSESFDSVGYDLWLLQVFSLSSGRSVSYIGPGGDETGYALVECSDGGFAVTGRKRIFGHTFTDLIVVRTDHYLRQLWNRTFNGPGAGHFDEGYAIIECSDGGFAIIGETTTPELDQNIWLLRLDANGNPLWNKTYGGVSYDIGRDIMECSDGGFLILGSTCSYSTYYHPDVWLIRTDSGGTPIWNRTYGGLRKDDWGNALIECNDGGFAITGETDSYDSSGFGNCWLIRTDVNGNAFWNHTYGGGGWDLGEDIVECDDGGFAIIGKTDSKGAGSHDVWLVRTNSTGHLIWDQTYGGTQQDWGHSIIKTSNDDFIIVGETGSYGYGGYDLWLLRVTDEAPITTEPPTTEPPTTEPPTNTTYTPPLPIPGFPIPAIFTALLMTLILIVWQKRYHHNQIG